MLTSGLQPHVAARHGGPEEHAFGRGTHELGARGVAAGERQDLQALGDLRVFRDHIRDAQVPRVHVVAAEHHERTLGDIERREAGRAGVLGADWFDAGLGGDKGCRAEARQQNGGNDA